MAESWGQNDIFENGLSHFKFRIFTPIDYGPSDFTHSAIWRNTPNHGFALVSKHIMRSEDGFFATAGSTILTLKRYPKVQYSSIVASYQATGAFEPCRHLIQGCVGL